MKVWVTRAEPGASATAGRLRAMGHEPAVAPLLKIAPLTAAVELNDIGALAFTSQNGVGAFSALTGVRNLPVYAVGDATAEAARGAGFGDLRSASGAVDDLIDLIVATHDATSGLVLWAGAREAADNLPAALAAQGVPARGLVVYDVVETLEARTVRDGSIDAVLIHSPRAARALAAAGAEEMRPLRVVCISDAAAIPLRGAGFTQVAVAAHPDEPSLLAALGKAGPPV